MWLRIGLFLLIYALMHWAYQSLRSSRFDPWFIHTLTVAPAASLIGWIAPLDAVGAVGPRLVWPGGRLTLLAGCDGFELMSLFIAALLVAEIGWRRGLVALIGGCAVVWGLNQVRIVVLYWAFRYERGWFDSIHSAWGPLVLIALTSTLFWWIVVDRESMSFGVVDSRAHAPPRL